MIVQRPNSLLKMLCHSHNLCGHINGNHLIDVSDSQVALTLPIGPIDQGMTDQLQEIGVSGGYPQHPRPAGGKPEFHRQFVGCAGRTELCCRFGGVSKMLLLAPALHYPAA